MNLSDLEKLKAAYGASTPGEWVSRYAIISTNAEYDPITIAEVIGSNAASVADMAFILQSHNLMPELLRIAEKTLREAEVKSDNDDYVERVIDLYKSGQDNAYEVYKRTYGATHEQAGDETDLDFIRRCAEQDFEDGETGGAVYQDIYDEITGRAERQSDSPEPQF